MSSKKIAKIQAMTRDIKFDSESENESEDEKITRSRSEKSIEYKTGEIGARKLDQREHILHRPDTYIGSVVRNKSSGRIWVLENSRFKCREAYFTEGLLRIFMEPASNAIDNIWRSKQFKVPAKIIRFTINRETGWISVWNDGLPIPLCKFKDEKTGIETGLWYPEEIFGSLLTSSNYNDSESRKTSGKNGFGSKLTIIFSKMAEVEIFNPKYKAIYKQIWSDNMTTKQSPVWDKDSSHFPTEDGKTGYTLFKFKPDYDRLDFPNGLDDDMMAIIEKSIYDYALIASLNGVETFYNNKLVPVSDFKSYVNLYYDSPPEEMLQLNSSDCSVIIAPKADPYFRGDLMHVAFMNGILTSRGGVHVDAWDESIFRPIVNKINKVKPEGKEKAQKEAKKDKKTKAKSKPSRPIIDITHVRKYFSLFIVAEAENPHFSNQNKDHYNSPAIETRVRPADIKKLMTWSFVERIEEGIKLREFSSLKDAGKKKRNYLHVEGLEDANYAGDPKRGKDCILCLSEGSSAASYITIGMKYGIEDKVGQDNIGIMALRGKILNLRKAPVSKILKNKEIMGIIRALGLEYGVDYTDLKNRNKLRYGKLYMIGDSDLDGAHITGLVLNAIDTLFPSLLDSNDFFHFMRVPIVKINMKSEQLAFLFYYAAQKYLQSTKIPNPRKNIKYFKGLGTGEKKDIAEDFGKYPVSLIMSDQGRELLSKVFGDDTDFRKSWLLEHKDLIKERKTPDYEIEEVPVDQFLNEEMRLYSLDSCRRAIPCVLDGLKESTRKIISACFKRKLHYNKDNLKVAQLAGYVAEHMGYHHGEQNIPDTIAGLAQSFCGSNNIPLLYASGFFGSRQGGGASLTIGGDAAASRYIFTKLEMLTRLIFRPEDDVYLPDRIEDGEVVEKEYYMPIIPMILVNGSSGIGTGSSSQVPMYNVFELIDWILIWLEKKGQIQSVVNGLTFYETPNLCPYYRGFEGKIEQEGLRINTYGKMEEIKKDTWHITEIPIGRLNTSIKKYRTKLEKMKEEKKIKTIKGQKHDENKPDFTITVDEDGIKPTLKNMKLIDTLSTSNMVLFDENLKLHKYPTIESILSYYCERRLAFYKIRKEGELKAIREELQWISNKIRFIRLVDKGKLVILDRNEDELDSEMIKLKFDKKAKSSRGKKQVQNNEEEDNDSDIHDSKEESKSDELLSFDYLLSMQARTLNIRSRVFKALEKEQQQLQEKLDTLEKMEIDDIWRNELNEFKEAYKKWEKRIIKDSMEPKKSRPKSTAKKSKSKVKTESNSE